MVEMLEWLKCPFLAKGKLLLEFRRSLISRENNSNGVATMNKYLALCSKHLVK